MSQVQSVHPAAPGRALKSPALVVPRAGEATCVRELGGRACILAGSQSDHAQVLELLVHTRQAPLAEDFQSRLDQPSYQPSNRLLVRRDRSLIAHVHLAGHIAWFDGQRVPLVKFEDFAALPEYRHAGYEDELVRMAESMATADGAVAAVAHADRPEFFQQHGWSLLRGQGHTRADARGVLAHLDAQSAARRRRRAGVAVRTWRHFEMDALRAIYDQIVEGLWGPLYRSEACWQWLIGRKAQDQILLAVEQRRVSATEDDNDEVDGAEGRIVGYAVVRGSCIVEMMTAPGFASARTQLLARACRDAIDRDHHWISLYTPAADALHELLVTAGGAWISDAMAGGPRWLLKLLAPEKWVERLYPTWHARARAAGVPRPFELGLAAGRERWRFTLTRRSARLERVDALPADWVEGAPWAIDSLLAGNLAIKPALAEGSLRWSDPKLYAALAAVFPARLFWQSPLEVMRL